MSDSSQPTPPAAPEGEREARYTLDQIAQACVYAEIPDSQFESLSIGLEGTVPTAQADTAIDWPCAKLLVFTTDKGTTGATATLYTPGLPDGEHDVWSIPVAHPSPQGAEPAGRADELAAMRAERDEWAAKWQQMRRLYADLKYPGLDGVIRAKSLSDGGGLPLDCCACGDQFTLHDRGTCGNCLAAELSGQALSDGGTKPDDPEPLQTIAELLFAASEGEWFPTQDEVQALIDAQGESNLREFAPNWPERRLPDDGAGDEDSYNAGWNDCRIACHAALSDGGEELRAAAQAVVDRFAISPNAVAEAMVVYVDRLRQALARPTQAAPAPWNPVYAPHPPIGQLGRFEMFDYPDGCSRPRWIAAPADEGKCREAP